MFFGKKDAPYGYMLVDHANKTVIHGARVLAVEEFLDFTTPEERFNRIEDYIDRLLTLNPKITQGEIYSKYNPQIEMFARFKMKSSFHKTKRII